MPGLRIPAPAPRLTASGGPAQAMPHDALPLPDALRPAAEALVAELRGNPLLSGFTDDELLRLVCSTAYRRTLEREHLAMQSGFRLPGGRGGTVADGED